MFNDLSIYEINLIILALLVKMLLKLNKNSNCFFRIQRDIEIEIERSSERARGEKHRL